MLVGHVHHLITRHPGLEYLLVPYLCSEDGERTTTCSKYRDAGGVALRSLTTTLDYLLRNSSARTGDATRQVFDQAGVTVPQGLRVPVLLQPHIRSLDYAAMFHVCFGVYCDVFRVPPLLRMGEPLVPARLRRVLAPHLQRCAGPFQRAYATVMRGPSGRLERALRDPRAVRVALIGREYLLEEPLLTADLKAYFMKAGARVLTPADVWPEEIPPGPHADQIFYDTHRHLDAFVEHIAPHVDGFVFAGCFGCHPDAFILDLLLDRVRQRGIPAWLFRYDEQVGSAGFQTRYETIMRFLEQRRDRRVAATTAPASSAPADSTLSHGHPPTPSGATHPTDAGTRVPLLTWPFMSDQTNLIMQEIAAQTGLTPYVVPPRPVTDVTLTLAGDTFIESCCPYAFSTGSFIETLNEYFRAHPDGPPRRIVMLMARGEGPCTFGLYLPGQARDVPARLGESLRRGGHVLESISIGLSDATQFIRELAELGDRRRLGPIADYMRMRADGTLARLSAWRRMLTWRRVWATISDLVAPARAKLTAAEAIRARVLVVLAHETERGTTNEVYRRWLAHLDAAHAIGDIHRVQEEALAALAAVPQDGEIKPRVAVVGEIYVVQAPFANRGVIDTLLARHGIEVVEGTTLSSFVTSAEREMGRRAWANAWPLRPILQVLWRRNIPLLQGHAEGREARPFMNLGVGGEGNLSVAHARRLLEGGVDGVVHVFPFKCMPEGIAKAAMTELCRAYGVPYLPLSFNRELEIERVKTEIATFASLLRARVGQTAAAGREAYERARAAELARRKVLSRTIDRLDRSFRPYSFSIR